ncbi:hypothetical protein ES708_24466 [subsurface metagenome]
MKLPKVKEILDLNVREAGSKMPPDTLDALKIASHAISRIVTMRSYGINQAILPLPGENPIPDLSPSADRKQRLRESPLGREHRH